MGGKSNKEIAQQVFLSVRSIEKIRQDIKDQLGIRSTVGLLKYALQRKIIMRLAENHFDLLIGDPVLLVLGTGLIMLNSVFLSEQITE